MHAAEHQSFYRLGLLFLMEVAKFYDGPAMVIVTCFLARPDCRIFLPEHCNTIIKQQLCGEVLPLLLLQVDVFQEKQGILQQIILSHQTNQKKLASVLDPNNSTQILKKKKHHTVTESLYQLCGSKTSWTPTLAGVS